MKAAAKRPPVASSASDDPFDTPEKAYAEAERLIAEAHSSRATVLTVQLRWLERLPPSIAGLTALRTLRLDQTQVADLAPLRGLTALQTLRLVRTRVADLAPLRGLTALQTLWLSGTPVADLAPLAGLTALQTLWLDNTRVADLAPLAGLTALQTLGLDNTRVADLAPLAGLTALQTLGLDFTRVADLAPLAGLTRMIDAVHEAWSRSDQNFRASPRRDLAGLHYAVTPGSAREPFRRLASLGDPHRTIETINYLREQQGLPRHIPDGYAPPSDVSPGQDDSKKKEEPNRKKKPPPVPPQKPAAVEPVVENGKITLPSGALKGDLEGDDLAAALLALKNQIRRMANAARDEGNLGQRIVRYLDGLADRIPETAPQQHVLFEIAHELEAIERFAKTVNDEWPEELAAQYHALTRGFDRTVRQFPRWRQFSRNAAADQLSDEQRTEAPLAIKAATAELRSEDALPVVDEAIPQAIDRIAAPPPDFEPEPAAGGASAKSPIDAGNEALLEDALESLSNTLKVTAELALKGVETGGDAIKPELGAIGRGFEKGRKMVDKEIEKDTEAVVVGAYKWMRRIAKTAKWGALATGGATAANAGYGVLISKFPSFFGWLDPVLKFFGAL